MTVLTIYARIYAGCLRKALAGIGKNLWTLLLPIGLFLAWFALLLVTAPLGGLIGGLVAVIAIDALLSCYLYFLGEVVSNSKASLKEFGTSIKTYFWSVMNLGFVFWVASFVLGLLLGEALKQG